MAPRSLGCDRDAKERLLRACPVRTRTPRIRTAEGGSAGRNLNVCSLGGKLVPAAALRPKSPARRGDLARLGWRGRISARFEIRSDAINPFHNES